MDSLSLNTRKYTPTTKNTLVNYNWRLLAGQATFSIKNLINL